MQTAKAMGYDMSDELDNVTSVLEQDNRTEVLALVRQMLDEIGTVLHNTDTLEDALQHYHAYKEQVIVFIDGTTV